MEAIYASKLYKASKRKDAIRAAIENPVNTELVAQLAKYLDKEYQKPEYVNPSASAASESESDTGLNPNLGDDFSPSDNLVHVPSGGGDLGPMPDVDGVEDNLFNDDADSESDDTPSDDSGLDVSDDVADDVEPVAVEESTKITASTDIDKQVMKGTLNSRQDTNGVNRIQQKESELWIYYNDDINLNNVMTQVIELLSTSDPNLEFNRLARTDNAIVFQIVDSVADFATKEETK